MPTIHVGRHRRFVRRRLSVRSDDDSLKLPVVQLNRKNLLIERVEIDMEPSVSLFEEELCRLINKDRMEKKKMMNTTVSNLVQDASHKVTIVERRLRVMSRAFLPRQGHLKNLCSGGHSQWTMLCSRSTDCLSHC